MTRQIVNISQIVQEKTEQKMNMHSNKKEEFKEEEIDYYKIIQENENMRRMNFFLKISQLPVGYEKLTFKNVIIESEAEEEIYKKLKYYCDNFKKAKEMGIGLYLAGNVGTGKTYATLCVLNELLSRGFKIYRTTLNGIYQRIQSSFTNLNDLTEEIIFKELFEVDLIILDDLGKESVSKTWAKDKMFTIFNFFYEKKKCVLISTNLKKGELTEFLKTNNDDAILDRIYERLDKLYFTWSSKRKQIGENLFEEFWNTGEEILD